MASKSTSLRVNRIELINHLEGRLATILTEKADHDAGHQKFLKFCEEMTSKYQKKLGDNVTVEVINERWTAMAYVVRITVPVSLPDGAQTHEYFNRDGDISLLEQYIRTLNLVQTDEVPLTGALRGAENFI